MRPGRPGGLQTGLPQGRNASLRGGPEREGLPGGPEHEGLPGGPEREGLPGGPEREGLRGAPDPTSVPRRVRVVTVVSRPYDPPQGFFLSVVKNER